MTKKNDTDQSGKSASKGERIAKVMARAGLCSRREAERWIEAGRVRVNGETLNTAACVVSEADEIIVDGKPLQAAEPTKLWRYHKKAGLIVADRDPEGRPTIFEHLPPFLPRVVTVGRLDFNTEGLLLLTNDGELARHLELPSTGWTRRYRVRAHGKLSKGQIETMAMGMKVDGIQYGPIQAEIDRVQGTNLWLSLSLEEGKNREIRRVLAALGLQVNRLIRTSYGPFQLGRLKEGDVEQVPGKVLKDQLGDLIKG